MVYIYIYIYMYIYIYICAGIIFAIVLSISTYFEVIGLPNNFANCNICNVVMETEIVSPQVAGSPLLETPHLAGTDLAREKEDCQHVNLNKWRREESP